MNKIFKVLWNRSRGVRVVTNETKTACGKGRPPRSDRGNGRASILN